MLSSKVTTCIVNFFMRTQSCPPFFKIGITPILIIIWISEPPIFDLPFPLLYRRIVGRLCKELMGNRVGWITNREVVWTTSELTKTKSNFVNTITNLVSTKSNIVKPPKLDIANIWFMAKIKTQCTYYIIICEWYRSRLLKKKNDVFNLRRNI